MLEQRHLSLHRLQFPIERFHHSDAIFVLVEVGRSSLDKVLKPSQCPEKQTTWHPENQRGQQHIKHQNGTEKFLHRYIAPFFDFGRTGRASGSLSGKLWVTTNRNL